MCNISYHLGTKLSMSSLSLSTAVTLLYRFHRDHKEKCFDLKVCSLLFVHVSYPLEL